MQKVIKADSALASYFKSNPKLKLITKFHFCPVPPCTTREHLTQLRGGLLCVLCLLSIDLEPTSILTPLILMVNDCAPHSGLRKDVLSKTAMTLLCIQGIFRRPLCSPQEMRQVYRSSSLTLCSILPPTGSHVPHRLRLTL